MDPSEQAAPSSASAPETAAEESGIDIDLTLLNSTMLYSEVYSMMVEPEAFLGKTVRLAGYCTSSYYEPTDMTYYAVIIPDATACPSSRPGFRTAPTRSWRSASGRPGTCPCR